MIVEAIFRIKRGTAANWTSVNPVLKLGEPGLETDTRKVKYGDGATAWNALGYQEVDLPATLVLLAALNTTAFGRALLELANAAALRTAAALGALAILNSVNNGNWSGTALAVANGGTGATTASGARTNLGLGGVAVLNVGTGAGTVAAGDDSRITGAAQKASNLSDLANAGTARTNLGLGALAVLATVNNANWSGTALALGNGGTGATTAAAARTALGLGALATLSTINGGNWSGTDLAVADGGTGASTAPGARTALGVAIGGDVLAYDAGIQALAGKSVTGTGDIVLANSPTMTGTTTMGTLRAAAGSAAAPGISFALATSSGLRAVSGAEFRLTAAGVDVAGVYSAGFYVVTGMKLHMDGGGNTYFVGPATNELDVCCAAQIVQHWTTAGTRMDKPTNYPPIGAPAAPASGWTLYADSGTGEFRAINAAGTVRTICTP